MNHLRTAVSQFDRIEIRELRNVNRIAEKPRIGVQYPLDIFPDRYAVGTEDIACHRGRIIRALPPERRRTAAGRRTDKSLRDKDLLGKRINRLAQQKRRTVDIDIGLAVTAVGHKTTAHIEPAIRHPLRRKISGYDRRRDQFAITDDPVVPTVVIIPFRGCRKQTSEFGKQCPHPVRTGTDPIG